MKDRGMYGSGGLRGIYGCRGRGLIGMYLDLCVFVILKSKNKKYNWCVKEEKIGVYKKLNKNLKIK